jgi:hypothetical protein
MTVKELIEKLSLEDPNRLVVVDGYEEGYDTIASVDHVYIKLSVNKKDKWYVGEFKSSSPSEKDSEVAILLPRKS